MTDAHEHDIEGEEELRRLLGLADASEPVEGAEDDAAADLAALRDRVRAGVGAEDARPLAKLRQRPFWQRNAIGVASLLVLVGALLAGMPRPDLEYYPVWRLGLELGSFVAVFALCLAVATRGAHLPPLPRARTLGLAALAVLIVAVVGLLPPPHAHDAYTPRGLLELLSPCALVGVAVAVPIYLCVRVMDRGSSLSAIAAASAAGLAANTLLQVRCHITDNVHILLGHATIGVWLVLGVVLVAALERRRAR